MKNIVDRIESRGATALSDEELVAVVVAESADDERAKSVASELMALNSQSLVELSRVSFSRLRMMAGIGKQRAMRLQAAMELGRRVALSDAGTQEVVQSDRDVVRIMESTLANLQHEECWALYLASSGRIIERMRVSQGGVQATVVDCKLIVKRAIELLATQIVLVHNHPSGSAEPSRQDMELTERVAEAAQLFDMRLLDHVIISAGTHYSFRAHNLVK